MNVRTWLRGAGLALATCTGIAGIASAQPANDLCANAIDLSAVTLPYASGNINYGTATNDTVPTGGVVRCVSSSTPANTVLNGVWWKYTTGASPVRAIFGETTTVDSAFSIYSGADCSSLTYVMCWEDETGIQVNLAPNTTYWIVASGWSSSVPVTTANLAISFNTGSIPSEPANSTCATAESLSSLTSPDSRQWGGSLNSAPFPTCVSGTWSLGGNAQFPVWYTYTTGASIEGFVWTENTANDVVVNIFSGTCGSLTQLSCNNGGSGTTETGSATLAPSTTYYIQVSANGATPATFSESINFGWTITLPPPPPANATCASATVVSTFPYVSGLVAIGGSPNDTTVNPSCDSGSNPTAAVNPVWWSVTPSSTGAFQFLETTSTDSVITIWTGACGGGQTQFTCDDAGIDGTGGTIRVLNAGTTYFVALSRFSGSVGTFSDNFNLTINQIAAPANDVCSSAVVVNAPTALAATNVDARGATSDVGLSCNTTGFTTSTTAGVWYQVNNPGTDWVNVTYTETATGTDAIWGIFTGSCGSLTNVFCNTTDSANTWALGPGQTAYFLVGRQGSNDNPTATTSFTVAFSFATLTSACCNSTANTCTVVSLSACTTAGGVWSGPRNVTCNVATSAANACQLAPANDLCANAVAISGSLPQTFTVTNAQSATDDVDSTCNSTTAGGGSPQFFTRFGVWYTYTTGLDPGVLSISETNASNDVTIQLFTGSCGSLVPFNCLDAVDSTAGGTFSLNASTTYYILVGMWGHNTQPSSTAPGYTVVANSFTAVTGACCNVTSCSILPASACAGLWLGANTSCVSGPTYADSIASGGLTIPDSNGTTAGTLARTINVSGSSTITSLTVYLDINLPFSGDQTIRLTAPNAVTYDLLVRPGLASPCTFESTGSSRTVNGIIIVDPAAATTFGNAITAAAATITSGTFAPSGCTGTAASPSISDLVGSSADGNWTLTITDNDQFGTNATLRNWGLVVNGVVVGPCDNAGACCTGTSCSLVLNSAACSGSFQAGVSCSPDPCVAANVVCCRGTICSLIPASSCTAPAGVGVAQAAGSSCNASGDNLSPCCFADFNKDGSRTIDDIFIYINAWFGVGSNPFTKVGGDGVANANIDDLFIFINVWFAAGCG